MDEMILNINGVEFVVVENSGTYSYYKLVDGIKLIPSFEELQKILDTLSKMNKVSYTPEEIKNMIREKIANGEIKTQEQLYEFLSSFELTSELEELKKYGNELLQANNVSLTPIEEFVEYIKTEYNKAMYSNSYFEINFDLNGSVDNKYFEVSLATEQEGKKVFYNKKQYIKFDDETTLKLINPIIREFASKGVVYNDYNKRSDDMINNRYDYSLVSKRNCNVNITNVENYYAEALKKEAMSIQNNYGNDYVNESSVISDRNYDDLSQSELAEIYSWEQINEMNELGFKPSEYERWRENNLRLTRKIPDDKGFVSLLVISISEFLTVLFVLLQMILS